MSVAQDMAFGCRIGSNAPIRIFSGSTVGYLRTVSFEKPSRKSLCQEVLRSLSSFSPEGGVRGNALGVCMNSFVPSPKGDWRFVLVPSRHFRAGLWIVPSLRD